MSVDIKPLGARVLVQRLALVDRTTESGIIVPTKGIASTYKSCIIALGDDITKDIHVGDIIISTQFVGDVVNYEQDEFYIIAEEDLLAVVPS